MDRMDEAAQVVLESCLVAPSSETPNQPLWLSPLDRLMATRGHTPFVQFYRCPSGDGAAGFFDVARLKAALGKALVAFYPFAGRLGVNQDGRLEINCNAQGALFLVARNYQLTVDDFSGSKPSPELRRLLVPRVDDDDSAILCAIQVTFFKCGGVAIGTAVHHAAMDGSGVFHFNHTWSVYCRDGERAVVDLPCHDRTLLSPRDPPVVRPGTLSTFCPVLNLSETSSPVVTEVFVLTKDQISALKRLCGSGSVSTFCAVTAHVWQCVSLARRLPHDSTTRLTFPAIIRRSLTPPLPDGYFGNAMIFLGVACQARDIATGRLDSVVGRIRGAIGRMDDELVRSAIDYLEMAKIGNRSAGGSLPATDLRVISWLGMPLNHADFHWGKPAAVLRAESNHGGFVHLIDGSQGDGSVRVVICMEPAIVDDFKRLLYPNQLHSML